MSPIASAPAASASCASATLVMPQILMRTLPLFPIQNSPRKCRKVYARAVPLRSTASKRQGTSSVLEWRSRYSRAVRRIRSSLRASIDSDALPYSALARCLTSTNTTSSPSCITRSSSPRRSVWFAARKVMPTASSWQRARRSAQLRPPSAPVRSDGRDVEFLRIGPQPLEVVESAGVPAHQMNDYGAVVDQDPAVRRPFHAAGQLTVLLQLLPHRLLERPELWGRFAGRQDEVIERIRYLAQVQHRDVATAAVVDRVDYQLHHLVVCQFSSSSENSISDAAGSACCVCSVQPASDGASLPRTISKVSG